ncbi:MAG: hypothetical protein K2O04_05355 [Clostridiales bacterium]|nr:hypothetical protein [Clostridiales bacterium]
MNIFILKKSLSDLKNPIVKCEYDTDAKTVGGFICEMVEKNYRKKKPNMTLEECKQLAMDEFSDGSYYIVNTTQDIKYSVLEQATEFCEGDEVVLIKLKYLRGIIWI